MNNNAILIAVICGLIAALLFLSPFSLGALGMGLSSFTALPLFVAVLGFGTIAGIISCVVSALIIAVFFGPVGALSVLVATLGPALWIGHSAGLARHDDGREEWFPLSLILFRLAVVSAAVVIFAGYFSGYSDEWAQQQATDVVKQLAEMQAQANENIPTMSDEDIARRVATFTQILPYVMPASILLLMVMNLRFAERIVRSRNWILRPRDDIPTVAGLPMIALPIFVGAIGVAFMDNSLGLIGKVLAGAFGGAFVLVGLATVHAVSRGWPARPVVLPLTYITLFFSSFIAPLFAALGCAETFFQLRARFSAGQSNTPHSNNSDKDT